MNLLSFKISQFLKKKRGIFSHKMGLNQFKVFREVLQVSFSHDNIRKERSLFDLSGDLSGMVKGPDDLSMNKKYLDGFGA